MNHDFSSDPIDESGLNSGSEFSIFNFQLSILHEEGPCLAIDKPAGLLTQAPRGIDSLEYRVRQYLMRTEGRGENGYLGVPHRLDRPVSGVILFGKHSRATRRLSEQFQSREIDKTYWAVVEGRVEPDRGTWIDFVRKIPDTAKAEIVAPINRDAREAILHYTVRDRFDADGRAVTRLEIQLETGRMHQIRVQSQAHGHPILGDAAYGSTIPFGDYFDDERRREIALHARSIAFRHPMTREPVLLTAPLPPLWARAFPQQSFEAASHDDDSPDPAGTSGRTAQVGP